MEKMTCEDVFDGDLDPVWRHADDSWRHGSYVSEVYKRVEDDTYWMFNYRLSTDGETNELREGFAEVCQVWPEEVVTVRYTSEPQKDKTPRETRQL